MNIFLTRDIITVKQVRKCIESSENVQKVQKMYRKVQMFL